MGTLTKTKTQGGRRMNQLQIFSNAQFGEVRVATAENNEPLFCLADVCRILDLQTGATKNRLNERGISLINTPTTSGNQKMIFVDEPNFYKAVFQSRNLNGNGHRYV